MFLGEKIIDERHIQIIWEDSEEQQSRECMNKIWLNMKQNYANLIFHSLKLGRE